MLNIRIGEPGTQTVVQASGETKKIICELAIIAISLYQTMRRTNPAVAEAYRRAVADVLSMNSPWWDKPVEGIGLCVPVKSGDA